MKTLMLRRCCYLPRYGARGSQLQSIREDIGMRHTRRSTRISYAEPPANLDDLQLDNGEENGMSTARQTRHGSRRNRDIAELQQRQQELAQEELELIRPQKRSKHNHRPATSSSKDFDWRDYISEDTLKHVDKTMLPEIPTDSNGEIAGLIKTWYYQFVMSWFNNVCDSYITTVLYSIRPLWKDIKFDEILVLKELANIDQYNDDENDEKSLVDTLKLKLLRLLMNTKKVELIDWDQLVPQQLNNYHPTHSYPIDHQKFIDLPLIKQFECYYYIIKIIETKSMTFKNYLNNHLEIFQFPIIASDTDPNLQIMIMPTHGSIVEVNTTTVTNSETSKLHIPIKLSNCVITKETSTEKELIHLDYSQEIDSYLDSIKIEYNVKTWDWPTFLEYIKNANETETHWLTEFIEIKMTHLLYSAKLIIQREKAKQIAELMTRRKRSSRLVAREEETKKKEVNDFINEKLDERDHFLKNRHRSLAKYNKRLKDILWNLLWFKFDQDFKLIKLQEKNIIKLIEGDQKLTPTDSRILNHGAYFTRSIIDIGDESMYIHNSILKKSTVEEIPKELCLTTKDLTMAKENNIELNNILEPDNQDWIFHCICDDDTLKQFNNENEQEILNNSNVYNHKLICCDLCHIWEHWDCQPQENIDYLSQMHTPVPKKGAAIEPIKSLGERDFAIVTLGKISKQQYNVKNEENMDARSDSYRRSARLATVVDTNGHDQSAEIEYEEQQHESHSLLRPTDLRSRYGQASPYICGFCMKLLEKELRNVFTPELEIIRFKQRKGHDDRERRKQKKLEKEKLQAVTETTDVVSNDNSPFIQASQSSDIQFQPTSLVNNVVITPSNNATPASIQDTVHDKIQVDSINNSIGN